MYFEGVLNNAVCSKILFTRVCSASYSCLPFCTYAFGKTRHISFFDWVWILHAI